MSYSSSPGPHTSSARHAPMRREVCESGDVVEVEVGEEDVEAHDTRRAAPAARRARPIPVPASIIIAESPSRSSAHAVWRPCAGNQPPPPRMINSDSATISDSGRHCAARSTASIVAPVVLSRVRPAEQQLVQLFALGRGERREQFLLSLHREFAAALERPATAGRSGAARGRADRWDGAGARPAPATRARRSLRPSSSDRSRPSARARAGVIAPSGRAR